MIVRGSFSVLDSLLYSQSCIEGPLLRCFLCSYFYFFHFQFKIINPFLLPYICWPSVLFPTIVQSNRHNMLFRNKLYVLVGIACLLITAFLLLFLIAESITFLVQMHIQTLRGRILETILSLRFFMFQYGIVYKLHLTGKDTSLAVCFLPF